MGNPDACQRTPSGLASCVNAPLASGTGKRAGVRHYGFRAFRHFVATYLHDKMKIPTGVISGILGHQSKRTTEVYLHWVDESAREAMRRLEGFWKV